MAAQFPLVEMPLFPLATVLYPEGQMSLRIFEPRYLDLVRECARHGSGFGVCLMLQEGEAGAPTTAPSAIGTVAHITDFNSGNDGLLTILAEGGVRFQVMRSRARADGLLRGEVKLWPAERLRKNRPPTATSAKRPCRRRAADKSASFGSPNSLDLPATHLVARAWRRSRYGGRIFLSL